MDKLNGDDTTRTEESKKLLGERNAADLSSKYERNMDTDLNKNNLNFSKANEKSCKNQNENQKTESFELKVKTDVDIELGNSPPKCTHDWKPVTFKQLPDWMQDNDYIHSWYRPPLPSVPVCLASVFRIHNETGNIWTHLIGAVGMLAAAMHYYLSQGPLVATEKLLLLPFFVGSLSCLLLSTLYHTLNCHSRDCCVFTGKMDYLGITAMIVGSYVPWVHFSFYCRFAWRTAYNSAIVVLAVACVVVSMCKRFGKAKYRCFRATVFVAFACSGLIPLVHLNVSMGPYEALTDGHLAWFYGMAALYLVGTFLYAKRVPERYFPGKLDLFLHSHQIFHVTVVLAAFSHLIGIQRIIDDLKTCETA